MRCEDALLLISGRIDGVNTPEEDRVLQAHLESCSQCRGILQAFVEQNRSLAAMEAEPPSDLSAKVMAAIASECAPKKKRNKLWPVLAAAAAIALVVGLSAEWLPKFDGQTETAPIVARSLPEEPVAQAVNEWQEEQNGMTISWARTANVVETEELLPEMENCAFEVLENGSCLYHLPTVDSAEELSKTYNLVVFLHEQAEESYALLLP